MDKDVKMKNKAKPLILQRADPWVYLHFDGYYYFTASVPEYDRIELRRAETLEALSAAEPKDIWFKKESGRQSANIWAPEIHYLDGAWYIYYAAAEACADEKGLYDHRIYVLKNSSSDPLNDEWEECGQLKTHMESFCLDATVWSHKGRNYLIWAQQDPAIPGNSNLYIAELETPVRLKGTPVMISTPEYSWEKIGFLVNEGPACMLRQGRIFLSYSASATDHNYCMGLLYTDEDADLLNSDSWKKMDKPVFSSRKEEGIYGPGHSCFCKTREGDDVLVFHARNYKDIQGDPLYDPNRHTYIYRIKWGKTNLPCFKML